MNHRVNVYPTKREIGRTRISNLFRCSWNRVGVVLMARQVNPSGRIELWIVAWLVYDTP